LLCRSDVYPDFSVGTHLDSSMSRRDILYDKYHPGFLLGKRSTHHTLCCKYLVCAVFLSSQAGPALHRLGRAGLSGSFQMRAGPGLVAFWPAWWLFLAAWRLFLGGRAASLGGRVALFGGLSQNRIFCSKDSLLSFTKKVSKVRNINHIQLNHRSPAIAVFHPSTRPRLMQAGAGFLNQVQAGRLLTQDGPGRH